VSKRNGREQIEFGDFQTPLELAIRCCEVVRDRFGIVQTVVEPTCGEGTFAAAAINILQPRRLLAYEIHLPYVEAARQRIESLDDGAHEVMHQDFFELDWGIERKKYDGPVLFLGNPPWVTNSKLGTLASKNAPRKSNLEGLRGIEAMTGRSNFDISESVLLTLLMAMRPDHDSLAMLVKTATARKVLRLAWAKGLQFSHASMHAIDAGQSFGVCVDACLLLLQPSVKKPLSTQVCSRSPSLDDPADKVACGWYEEQLVSDPRRAKATRQFHCDASTPWRSGVKHDLARVLELTERDTLLFTRDGERVDIEIDLVYPLAKGADVANLRTDCPQRRILVPQRSITERTDTMASQLPKTYRYLQSNRTAFNARKSSIYRNRDPFAVFGIGPYTFAPWKVAICGLYKRLTFALYGPVDGRPVLFDDTTYCLSFETESQARLAQRLLESEVACQYFEARVFWDAKRPITAQLLRSLDLAEVARQIGCVDQFQRHLDNLPLFNGKLQAPVF
jgi:hypothetical protein